MAKLETRRINSIAHVAFAAVAILIVFEVLVIGGLFELQAQTVEKYAPWAYEPFLRLVGEHPESTPRWAIVEEPEDLPSVDVEETNVVFEVASPVEIDSEPLPAVAPTHAPNAKSEEIIPVG